MDPQRMAQYLPGVYRDAMRSDPVLSMLLASADRLHSPVERVLDTLDDHVDPRRAPDTFVPYLASWLGLDRYLDWPGGRQGHGTPHYAAGLPCLRELSARATELARWRGTRSGLERFLEIATGVPGFRVDEDIARGFHLLVEVPAEARPMAGLVARIVEEERPVYATYEIRLAPAASLRRSDADTGGDVQREAAAMADPEPDPDPDPDQEP